MLISFLRFAVPDFGLTVKIQSGEVCSLHSCRYIHNSFAHTAVTGKGKVCHEFCPLTCKIEHSHRG